jgi:8-oxo-dGTP pyrophosphatase MutT (NUDIX family)
MKRYDIGVAIIWCNDQLIMVKQSYPGTGMESFWSLPGGKKKGKETFMDAAIREAREETGILLKDNGELVYICEYTNSIDGFSCRVEAYEFLVPSVTFNPGEDGSVIQDACLLSVSGAMEKISALKDSPMVRVPLVDYLKSSDKPYFYWRYKTDKDGMYFLVEKDKLSEGKA